jgi:ADP-heptose:LPS heptosyltransferase
MQLQVKVVEKYKYFEGMENILIKYTNTGLGDILMFLGVLQEYYKKYEHIYNIFFMMDNNKLQLLELIQFDKICSVICTITPQQYYDFKQFYNFVEWTEHNIERFVKHKIQLYCDRLGIDSDSWKEYKIKFNVKKSNIRKSNNIGICLNSSTKFKNWTDEYNKKLILNLSKKYKVYLLGNDTLLGIEGENIINLCGRTSLKKFIETIADMDLIITPDTSTMHIAGLLDIPTIALFSSTDYRTVATQYNSVEIISADIPCSPCIEVNCNYRRCMLNITPEIVEEKVEQIFKNKFTSRELGKEMWNSGIHETTFILPSQFQYQQ